ncbi:SDR family oxidoreductase [Halobacillus litoralis]|uniref:SDR family oxidoreductase n=1 Tax=Halobacillus litoralis TaxID=45668 RepID=A0A845DVI8_9BACI|nr:MULTISPECIES: SDR family oxidoreductase [Halobacillus]MYL21510.1 SDR family oxidoreductase [Halobacillus litoralis]MYL30035.1 SDR family oxidoreductase [Halobacillus halophilus]MYL37502.1 SDR family oxidoreductase [Halobacillus litoralis]
MKWIIVTGESRGVGKEIARRILLEGTYGVIGISRSKGAEVEDLQQLGGDRFVHLCYDLDDVEGIKTLYLKKLKPLGVLYGFVNNSASAYDDIISNLRVDPLEKMFRINVLAPMHLTKYVIRDMLLNKTKGSVVHISSISAHTGYKGLSMYASTKGAIEAFSRNMAREWGARGIRSNCVIPGFMDTAMSASLTDEQKDRIYKRNAMKKETEIASVVSTVLFLLSEQSSSITGTGIHVDNGTI